MQPSLAYAPWDQLQITQTKSSQIYPSYYLHIQHLRCRKLIPGEAESEGIELIEFIGREQELSRIAKELNERDQRSILLYGRRRIGKSELIKQALARRGESSIYYECRQTSEADNVTSLSALVSEELDFPLLAFSGVREIIEFLFAQAEKRDIVLVLDEYPYREAVSGLE